MPTLVDRLSGSVLAVLAATLTLQPASLGAHQEQSSIEQVLQRVGDYVTRYEQAYAAIVSKETYVQRSFFAGEQRVRTLVSEVALVPAGAQGWVIFRDVVSLDGKPLRDRQDRLTALFLSPDADLKTSALQIAEESARYNLGPVFRTINIPTLALIALRAENQPRSAFRLAGRATIDGVVTQELRFEEKATPRMVLTTDNAAASGRAWVDPALGTVVRTEFRLESEGASAAVTVSYEYQSKVSLWLPVSMTDAYDLPGAPSAQLAAPRLSRIQAARTSIEGRATYDDFRQFSVSVAHRIIR